MRKFSGFRFEGGSQNLKNIFRCDFFFGPKKGQKKVKKISAAFGGRKSDFPYINFLPKKVIFPISTSKKLSGLRFEGGGSLNLIISAFLLSEPTLTVAGIQLGQTCSSLPFQETGPVF